MKALTKTLLATAAVAALATSAHAAVDFAGQPYVGVKVGSMDVDNNNIPKLTSYGVYTGYDFNNGFGVEADFTGTSTEDLKNYNNIEVKAKNYGLYGTYKYNLDVAPVYVKAKLGVAKTEVTHRSTLTGDKIKDAETRAAGGLGVGYNVTNNIAVEAMYNQLHSDVNNITAGVHIKF